MLGHRKGRVVENVREIRASVVVVAPVVRQEILVGGRDLDQPGAHVADELVGAAVVVQHHGPLGAQGVDLGNGHQVIAHHQDPPVQALHHITHHGDPIPIAQVIPHLQYAGRIVEAERGVHRDRGLAVAKQGQGWKQHDENAARHDQGHTKYTFPR
ncbi:MAG: hypothetical protein J5I62_14670 [Flavobacteriales bacterium]|nr:hypothetical protein [Flavobacteriales bacterium]